MWMKSHLLTCIVWCEYQKQIWSRTEPSFHLCLSHVATHEHHSRLCWLSCLSLWLFIEWYNVQHQPLHFSWGPRAGGCRLGLGLHPHSNRSRITAVAQSVMASVAHRPAAGPHHPPHPPLYVSPLHFLPRPSGSSRSLWANLITGWRTKHWGPGNWGSPLIGRREMGLLQCVCTPSETSYIRDPGPPDEDME